jgi:endonuclease/exonuclease/phosphatase family metal-dependent hydrolase
MSARTVTPTGRVRVVTLNLFGEQPPLERRMALVGDGLAALEPDVVALQEVRVVSGKLPNQAETLARRLGMTFVWEAATPWGGGEEGLALLARHPLTGAAAYELPHAVPEERRIVLCATVDTPAGPLAACTTHLNYRMADGHKRLDQAEAAAARAAALSAPVRVLAGDFNAVPDADEIRYLRGLTSHRALRSYWQDAWAVCHPGEAGYTWARANRLTERMRWLERDRRLDYIFVSAPARDGRGVVHDCRIVLDQPDASGLCASDHYGLLAEIQIAPDPVTPPKA